MIYDHISNGHRYAGLGEGFERALDFLKGATADLAEGRVELGDEDYANVQHYRTVERNVNGYEAHRRYADIQFVLGGRELVKVRPLEELRVTTPYDGEKDYMFLADDGGRAMELALGEGYFVILFPEDAHEPTLQLDGCQEVTKVVAKVRI